MSRSTRGCRPARRSPLHPCTHVDLCSTCNTRLTSLRCSEDQLRCRADMCSVRPDRTQIQENLLGNHEGGRLGATTSLEVTLCNSTRNRSKIRWDEASEESVFAMARLPVGLTSTEEDRKPNSQKTTGSYQRQDPRARHSRPQIERNTGRQILAWN